MEILKKLLNKRGLYNTFKVLSFFDNFRADKYSFYEKLNEFSYYNSFLRIKNALIKNELINVGYHNKTCYYELTPKGKEMFILLKKLDNLLKQQNWNPYNDSFLNANSEIQSNKDF